MRLQLLSLLAILAPYVLAEVEVTYPAAGDSIAAGSITVKWENGAASPALSELTIQTIQLMVGGNDDDDMLALTTIGTTTGLTSSTTSATGTISAGLAGDTKNGFFLKFTCAAAEGGTVINYSDRFTLTGMTGTTPSTYADAVPDSTDGPANVDDASNDAAASTAATANEYSVPYTLQTGLTRYAPMQSVPPTKITAGSPTPLFASSAWTVATTYMAAPTIVTTLTEAQTFSAATVANTIAAQSQPTGDAAKFLARWKD